MPTLTNHMNINKLIPFIFELGHLKKIKHEGLRYLGCEHPESVGEHALRAAQIGFILAKLEKYNNPHEVCTMVVFHDIGECRTGDLHLIAKKYGSSDEEQSVKDQTRELGETGEEILKLWQECEKSPTTAGTIAKDADILEQAVSAKEFLDQGKKDAILWIDYARQHLKTTSAKKLLDEFMTADSNQWWKSL